MLAVHRLIMIGDPKENRTPDCALRGRRLNRLTIGPFHLPEYIIIAFRLVQVCFLSKTKSYCLI